ncbi:MAG TPA: PSD1 and planctomycete cytochrome C domain-containing protein [Gemmataceae bacterium]|nr:PSD1 and planctomycete cytochrome C domain-containing protein [Gemmataceae bacterium]
MPRTISTAFLSSFLCFAVASAADPAAKPVNFDHDVRPIFAAKCYACHGPDANKRRGDLRLDIKTDALQKIVKPGDAAESVLFQRIHGDVPDHLMPPPTAKTGPLSPEQIDTLRRWVEQGAKFERHWAYVPPVRPTVPSFPNGSRGTRESWVRNPIDAFVAAAQEREGYQPAPEADRVTLLRRLSFDLTGLPPTPEEVGAFVKDSSPDAYDKAVDRLLASPHYGERMATYWLDLVRYADTGGYHSDNHRDVWMYRDYVIDAFNQNKPFDRFTMEQLAGDLLPNPTEEQRIASGYNRLLQTTEEGGAQPKEYTAKYAADRVRNASVVWLASTMGCAECHSHKFDPFTNKDFYSFEAFFADVKEAPVGRQEQTPFPSKEQAEEMRKLDEKIAAAKAALEKQTPELEAAEAAWEKTARATPPKGAPADATAALAIEPEKRTPQQKQAVTAYFRTVAPELADARAQVAKLTEEKKQLTAQIPTTLVTTAVSPRTVRILPRGNWLDDSGEIVQPAVPVFLANLDIKDRRPTRLDLAHWIASRDNPLTARVFVNRLWMLLYGQGIVRSPGDFGTQGQLPTHPELLDWLAVEFMDSGWDVKHMVKLIVTSNTYRQSSATSKELRERDPANVWLARQNRFRLDAEVVRDNALAISGLLSPKMNGPSVKPYQPAGYWSYLNFPVREWDNDKGENQYRRGLYTYWCRTFLQPSLASFDAPTREECTAERTRSSTPLQALVLLDDPTYVEAARVFAEHIVRQGGTPEQRLDWAYRHALSRGVKPQERDLLLALYAKHQREYAADKDAAQKAVSVGQYPVPKDLDVVELAAWTSAARVILNLDETITRN